MPFVDDPLSNPRRLAPPLPSVNAGTTANDGNFLMRYAFRYRDYVVDAFNRDKPYDQFIIEQLAGDLLPPTGDLSVAAQRVIATGFLMIGPKALAEAERARIDAEAEIARLTGKLERQAAMLDKLAYVNEELERQQRELLASRWRKLGLRLRLAKRAWKTERLTRSSSRTC